MKKNRVKIFLIGAVLIIISIVCIACTQPVALVKGNFELVASKVLPDLEVDENGQFDILTITDIHLLGYGNNDKKTINAVDKIIKSNIYELVVITGDMIEGFNKKSKFDKAAAIESIARVFEENEQYWSFVAGNNDGEFCGDKNAIFSALAVYKFCLVADAQVGGVGNFTINIVGKEKQRLHTLVFIDSGMRDENGELVAMTKEQIAWYESVARTCKQLQI